jgi:peroxiredoxin
MKSLRNFFTFLLITIITLSAQDKELKGKSAINFKLESIEGKQIELSDLIGKGPILINFWATWCKPCVEEMTELNKIYEEMKDKGFTLLAISIDNEKTIAKVKPFIKSRGYNFTVLFDKNSDVARKYYAQQIPYSILIDKMGKIIYTHTGFMKGDEKKLKEKIVSLFQ